MEALGQESRKPREQGSARPLSKSQTQGGETVDRVHRPRARQMLRLSPGCLQNPGSAGGTCLLRLAWWGRGGVCTYTFTRSLIANSSDTSASCFTLH